MSYHVLKVNEMVSVECVKHGNEGEVRYCLPLPPVILKTAVLRRLVYQDRYFFRGQDKVNGVEGETV
jgi:hypothetical protein